jgi:hypothetical protein
MARNYSSSDPEITELGATIDFFIGAYTGAGRWEVLGF